MVSRITQPSGRHQFRKTSHMNRRGDLRNQHDWVNDGLVYLLLRHQFAMCASWLRLLLLGRLMTGGKALRRRRRRPVTGEQRAQISALAAAEYGDDQEQRDYGN